MTMKADSKLVDALHPSPNTGDRKKGSRPRLILLHYTGMPTAEKAIHWLAHPKSKVSCHYVIDDTGEITQMVPEGMRAWHAGVSHWAGETDINSASIGIEIQNPGHEHGYPDFPAEQMQAVAALCRDIAQRRAIRAESILAHSDVAPGRKIDPGEKFDWAWLAANGVGHWVEPAPPDSGSGRAYAVNDEFGRHRGSAGAAPPLRLQHRGQRAPRPVDADRFAVVPAPLPPRARRRQVRPCNARNADAAHRSAAGACADLRFATALKPRVGRSPSAQPRSLLFADRHQVPSPQHG